MVYFNHFLFINVSAVPNLGNLLRHSRCYDRVLPRHFKRNGGFASELGFHYISSIRLRLLLVRFAIQQFSSRGAIYIGLRRWGACRCIPCFLDASTRGQHIWMLHVGQILNAIGGAFLFSTPSRLSALWFPGEQRTLATAIGSQANSLGSCLGFLVGPLVVQVAAQLPVLLYAEAAVALAVLLCALIHFPREPPSPPSASAAALEAQPSTVAFLRSLLSVMRNWSFALLVVAGGVQSGMFVAWSGVVPQILGTMYFTPQLCGYLVFGSNMAGIAAGVLISRIADTVLRRRFKAILIVFFVASVAVIVWATLSLPFLDRAPVIPVNAAAIGAMIVLVGLFLNASQPLFYELGAELTSRPRGHKRNGIYISEQRVCAGAAAGVRQHQYERNECSSAGVACGVRRVHYGTSRNITARTLT